MAATMTRLLQKVIVHCNPFRAVPNLRYTSELLGKAELMHGDLSLLVGSQLKAQYTCLQKCIAT